MDVPAIFHDGIFSKRVELELKFCIWLYNDNLLEHNVGGKTRTTLPPPKTGLIG